MAREKNPLKVVTEITALEGLLGAERVESVRDRIADLIVERVESDLNDWDEYIFYPSDYENDIREAYESVSKKIKKMYTDAMLEAAQKAVDKIKEGLDSSIQKEGATK